MTSEALSGHHLLLIFQILILLICISDALLQSVDFILHNLDLLLLLTQVAAVLLRLLGEDAILILTVERGRHRRDIYLLLLQFVLHKVVVILVYRVALRKLVVHELIFDLLVGLILLQVYLLVALGLEPLLLQIVLVLF